MQTVSKLHTVLRPYLLRRLKRDVEKELPSKFEHLTMCPLSKRQRFLYDEFMEQPSKLTAMFTSTCIFLGIAMVSLFSPVRSSSISP